MRGRSGELVCRYDKNTYSVSFGPRWDIHIEKIIEWMRSYYPGFFTRKAGNDPDSASYERFTPDYYEARDFIQGQISNGSVKLLDN